MCCVEELEIVCIDVIHAIRPVHSLYPINIVHIIELKKRCADQQFLALSGLLLFLGLTMSGLAATSMQRLKAAATTIGAHFKKRSIM